MRIRTSSNSDSILPLECIDEKRNIWRLRWDIKNGEFEELQLTHKPSLEEVKSIILDWYHEETVKRITYGFKWKGIRVCLSKENQSNYFMFCDTETVPIQLKFGTWDNPVYHKIETLEELKNFKKAISEHIRTSLLLGWTIKDNLDWSPYEHIINNNNR